RVRALGGVVVGFRTEDDLVPARHCDASLARLRRGRGREARVLGLGLVVFEVLVVEGDVEDRQARARFGSVGPETRGTEVVSLEVRGLPLAAAPTQGVQEVCRLRRWAAASAGLVGPT